MIYFKRDRPTRSPAVILILLAVIAPHAVHAAPGLTLHDCIEIALKNQPSIRAAKQNVNAGIGREMQARSSYFPQITASTGYSHNWSEGGAFGESVTKSYTTTVGANQLIYDFGKTGNALDAARWGTLSSERQLDRIRLDVILRVKQAYFALLAAHNLADVARKRVEQTELHRKQAEAFFTAGSKPKFEVTRAEVDVNTARMGLINAENGIRIQRIALNNAMGIDPGSPVEIEDHVPPTAPVPDLDQAHSAALAARPELLKAEADIETAKARLRAEKANHLPTFSANGAYNWANGTIDMGQFGGLPLTGDVGNSWNAGVVLSVPLFQGGLTRGRISETRAAVAAAEAERDAARQTVLLEVDQSYADMENAKVRIEVMESSLQKAAESLALAQGRYQAGVGPSIEVSDAQLASVQAETDYIQAHYDFQLSIARLFRAIGRQD